MKQIKNRWADKWKMHGDLAVVTIPLMIAAVENAPNIRPDVAYWIIQIGTVALAGFNFIAKTQQKNG